MERVLYLLFVLLVAGLNTHAIEDLGEETTTAAHGITDIIHVLLPDSQSSSESTEVTMKPSILNELEQVAWKIVQFDWNITSAIQRKLEGPLVKAIKMRTAPEAALARIIGLVEGGILSSNLKNRK